MSYFKDDEHQRIYLEMIRILENDDPFYRSFAFVASALKKNEIKSALENKRINPLKLISLSQGYTDSEIAMLEVAWQLFSSTNLYETNGENRFSTIDSIFESLDSENRLIVLHAIQSHYSPY